MAMAAPVGLVPVAVAARGNSIEYKKVHTWVSYNFPKVIFDWWIEHALWYWTSYFICICHDLTSRMAGRKSRREIYRWMLGHFEKERTIMSDRTRIVNQMFLSLQKNGREDEGEKITKEVNKGEQHLQKRPWQKRTNISDWTREM